MSCNHVSNLPFTGTGTCGETARQIPGAGQAGRLSLTYTILYSIYLHLMTERMTMCNHCNRHVSTSCIAAHASSTHLCFQSRSGISGAKCQNCMGRQRSSLDQARGAQRLLHQGWQGPNLSVFHILYCIKSNRISHPKDLHRT